jgi:hypothetical protein
MKNYVLFQESPANITALNMKAMSDLDGSAIDSVAPPKSKSCGGCDKELPIAMFNKNARAHDGLQSQCKDCNKQYREAMLAQYIGLSKFKICNKCAVELPIVNFGKDSRKDDGVHNTCKKCFNAAKKEYRRQNPEVIQQAKKKYREKYYEENKAKARQYYEENKERLLRGAKANRTGKEGYIKIMLYSARHRAKDKGWDFDLDLDELVSIAPDCCPVDGLSFDWERQLDDDETLPLTIPSLDRIDSSRGYTKDNVMIIGDKWNRWKNNMNLEDLELLIQYVRSVTKN